MVALDDTEMLSRNEGAESVKDAVERVVRLGMSLAGLALQGCDLTAADLTDANFTSADVGDTKATERMLMGTDLTSIEPKKTYLKNASLRNTDCRQPLDALGPA